jgi:ABC-2 type transport system permease protein
MKGLIMKDFINLKKNLKIFGVLTVLYAFMSFAMEDSSFFSSIFTMLFAILTLSLYSYDDLAKWDSYALTMPISKDNVVQGKYLMMLLLTFIGTAFSSIFSIIFNLAIYKEGAFQNIQGCAAGAIIVIFFYSIIIPFITKLGVEKARMVFFAVYFIPFLITIMTKKMMEAGELTVPENLLILIDNVIKYRYFILPAVVLAALGLSYMISIRIYRKKEF